ncbi:MAG TPA: HD domain-containing protein [Gaiellaceae bacterium]|nr:HD domain-containing protein [Gaiellaceae bacterium]
MAVTAETELEARVVGDPEWQRGASWGSPRPGHPEGTVSAHVEAVLANVDEEPLDSTDRGRLRLVALIHDTFKDRVDREQPPTGENHHAMIARRFAERFIEDPELLDVIELHDEAYNAWVKGDRGGKWDAAEARARRLLDRLGPSRDFYLRFYRADNRTGSKSDVPLEWFERLARSAAPSSDEGSAESDGVARAER